MLDPSRDPDIALPVDDELLGDLTAPKWKILSGGKIQVESKDDIRKRIGRSTDAGDAAVQAFWEEGFGAAAWIDWARKKAEAAEAERAGAAEGTAPESRQDGTTPPLEAAADTGPDPDAPQRPPVSAPETAAPEPAEPPLDPAEALRQARNASFAAGSWA